MSNLVINQKIKMEDYGDLEITENDFEIEFDEEKHEYKVAGVKAVSVTTFMKAIGLTEDFSKMPPAVQEKAKKAAEKGNYYDMLAEEALTEDPEELNEWQKRFLKVVNDFGFKLDKGQKRLGILKPIALAGTADFTGPMLTIDLKCTYQIYTTAVTWQTNLYSWMRSPLHYEKYKKYVIHYNENTDKFIVKELETIPREEIERAVQAYILGDTYNELVKIDNNLPIDINAFSRAYDTVNEFKEQVKKGQKQLDFFNEKLIGFLSDKKIKTLDLDNFKITLVEEGKRGSKDLGPLVVNLKEEVAALRKYLELKGYHLDEEDMAEMFEMLREEGRDFSLTEEEIEMHTKYSTVKASLKVTDKRKKTLED